ncbi:MAG: diacylglycerol kinase [Actinobacteria bacterium 13_2_20CM_2_71_6]|nr:MAG: diacylglycerol kinase [Actinobacteria bacterium 13_2_20CM_2_71_6]
MTEAAAPAPDKAGVGGPRSAVVVNPSKVIDLDGHRREICAALAEAGWPEPMWWETTPEDPGCGQASQAVQSGAEVVFACGGDGTVMACATSLAGTEVALAILPSGTGNLLATNMALPSAVPDGIRVAVEGARRRIDLGTCGRTYFTVMAGMGFDAQMIDATSERLKARLGWPAYVLAAVRHLRHRPMRVRIRLDGGTPLRRRARTVLVGNVGKLQGGIPLLPDAQPDDGWLDVAVLTPHTIGHWLAMAWGVLRRQRDVARMETYRARRVEIFSDRPQPRELDGDLIEPARSMEVTIRPAALWLCVPADPRPV